MLKDPKRITRVTNRAREATGITVGDREETRYSESEQERGIRAEATYRVLVSYLDGEDTLNSRNPVVYAGALAAQASVMENEISRLTARKTNSTIPEMIPPLQSFDIGGYENAFLVVKRTRKPIGRLITYPDFEEMIENTQLQLQDVHDIIDAFTYLSQTPENAQASSNARLYTQRMFDFVNRMQVSEPITFDLQSNRARVTRKIEHDPVGDTRRDLVFGTNNQTQFKFNYDARAAQKQDSLYTSIQIVDVDDIDAFLSSESLFDLDVEIART